MRSLHSNLFPGGGRVRSWSDYTSVATALSAVLCGAPLGAADAIVSGNFKVWRLDPPTTAERSAFRQQLYEGTVRDDGSFDRVVQWKMSELTREENLSELPKLRKQLRYDLSIAGKARSPAAHDRLNALLLAHLPSLVDDRGYHHGTRLTALILLGELNAVEDRPFDPASRAVPLADALPLLLDSLEPTAEGAAPQDLLPAGALIGLIRHARLGIADPALRHRALESAMTLAEESQPPAHRTADAHDWLRRRSIQLLAALIQPGASEADERAIQSIFSSIDDDRNSIKVQVESALAWGELLPRLPADRYPPARTLPKLAALAGRVVRSEITGASSDPAFVHQQSRRIVAARLGAVQAACVQLGIDVAAARRSPPPDSLSTPDQLYRGLTEWISQATNPRWDARRAAEALSRALPLLDKHSLVEAEMP